MTHKQVILFDLDGTLIDSAPGIFDTLEYTLAHFGITAPRAQFVRHLGPPMRHSLAEYVNEAQLEEALGVYRARYEAVGALTCTPYEGVGDMLQTLQQCGYTLCVATSKPQVYAEKILAHFGLARYFAEIGGAALDASLDTKESVMRKVMERVGAQGESCIMVGDRSYDMEGATACAIDALGVLYGYGTRQELAAYMPLHLAESVAHLSALLQAL